MKGESLPSSGASEESVMFARILSVPESASPWISYAPNFHFECFRCIAGLKGENKMYLDYLRQLIPGFQARCCLKVEGKKTGMLALQVLSGTSI